MTPQKMNETRKALAHLEHIVRLARIALEGPEPRHGREYLVGGIRDVAFILRPKKKGASVRRARSA